MEIAKYPEEPASSYPEGGGRSSSEISVAIFKTTWYGYLKEQ
jgi:hypothetical protein